ncbi:MAG: glycosyltransferase family 2 protein [Planctomycetota bacterium]|jgi:glycosyltransferase involved in cell wall biosynthesis
MLAANGLSIFFPAYNDWGTIASLVVLAGSVARELTDDFEIIVVNDASPDHTALILEELQAHEPRLRIVTHESNRGYGGALRSGFAAATKEWVFYTDGDAQYDVRELAQLWERREDADMVNGHKIARHDPLHRIVIGKLYHHLVRLAFGLRIRDVDCDFRLLRRSLFERIELTRDTGLICVELVTKVEKSGGRVIEVPVHHAHRAHGKSQFFNVRRLAQVALGMGSLWWELIVQRRIGRPAPERAA